MKTFEFIVVTYAEVKLVAFNFQDENSSVLFLCRNIIEVKILAKTRKRKQLTHKNIRSVV
jgi:hypothetical protein